MVTTNELNDAKDKILGQFILSMETNMDEAGVLNNYSALGYSLNALEEYKKLIEYLDTRFENIERLQTLSLVNNVLEDFEQVVGGVEKKANRIAFNSLELKSLAFIIFNLGFFCVAFNIASSTFLFFSLLSSNKSF